MTQLSTSTMKLDIGCSQRLLLYRILFLLSCTGTQLARSLSAQSLETSSLFAEGGPPLLDVPVYSLATVSENGETGMNILTYATPVSISPDRLWTIGLYKGTVAHENFVARRRGVLQLLTNKHVPLVRCLGGTSGRDVDKSQVCADFGFPWMENSIQGEDQPCRLPDCANYLTLDCIQLWDGGSHDVALCRVTCMEVLAKPSGEKVDNLSTGRLRELGIITEQGRVADENR